MAAEGLRTNYLQTDKLISSHRQSFFHNCLLSTRLGEENTSLALSALWS